MHFSYCVSNMQGLQGTYIHTYVPMQSRLPTAANISAVRQPIHTRLLLIMIYSQCYIRKLVCFTRCVSPRELLQQWWPLPSSSPACLPPALEPCARGHAFAFSVLFCVCVRVCVCMRASACVVHYVRTQCNKE